MLRSLIREHFGERYNTRAKHGGGKHKGISNNNKLSCLPFVNQYPLNTTLIKNKSSSKHKCAYITLLAIKKSVINLSES
jgi:hypothetical protein